MNPIIHIALLDDESLILEAITNLVSTNPRYKVVLKSNNGEEFLQSLHKLDVPIDILLLDINMKPLTGLQVLDELQKQNIEMKTLVLSSLYNSSMYGYMIKYGISGFLPKYCDKEELFTAIDHIYFNKFYINEGNQSMLNEYLQLKKKNDNPWNNNALTEREIEVIRLICQEYSTKEIAEKLFISVKTVESHRTKIMEKIGCKNAIGMVIYSIINGIYVLTN